MSDRKSLETGFYEIFTSMLCNVHTAIPGIVKSFDPLTCTVSVQPALKRKFEIEDEAIDLPIIEDVPVLYPGNSDYLIAFELEEDLPILLIVSERAIDAWQTKGSLVDPKKKRKFDLSDCIAIPRLFPIPNLPLVPVESGCISIRDKTNTTKIKLSDKVEILGDVEVTGSLTVLGAVEGTTVSATATSTGLGTHTHTDSVGGTTTPPTPGT